MVKVIKNIWETIYLTGYQYLLAVARTEQRIAPLNAATQL